MSELAILGGEPIRREPLPAWPSYDSAQIDAVKAVLVSGKVNYWSGQAGKDFEQAFAHFIGTQYGIALANGTVALELALMALGIGPGDEVIVPSRTFIATASSVVMRGATPVVVDVDFDSQNMTVETILPALTDKTKAIIPVHLGGWPCDMPAIMTLAEKHQLLVIEDCAQAHGAEISGQKVGAFGHAAAFSFCQDKIMSTGGEGGMLLMNDESLYKRAWSYKDHGKDYDEVYKANPEPTFRWLHTSFGTNWRMTEMQAAIGLQQLAVLPEWVDKRRQNAAELSKQLSSCPGLKCISPPEHIKHVYYRYYMVILMDKLSPGWDKNRITEAINAEGIPCFYGSCSEIDQEKAFAELPRQLPHDKARMLSNESIAVLIHPTITVKDVDDIAKAVIKVMVRATQ